MPWRVLEGSCCVGMRWPWAPWLVLQEARAELQKWAAEVLGQAITHCGCGSAPTQPLACHAVPLRSGVPSPH